MAFGTFSGGGLGFGVVFTLEDGFSNVSNKIERRMNGFSRKTDDIANKINESFGKIGAAVGLITTGLGILAPLGLGIKMASEFETTRVAFETMLGSAEKAKQLLEEIDDLAAKTPFELPDVEKGYKRLLAFGIAQDQVKEDFVAIGNIAAGTGAEINALIRAFGQVKGKGLLKGQEFMQFTEQGFDLAQALRNIGVDFDQTKQDVGQMNISWLQVREAIRAAAGAGGQFDGLMNKLSATTTGKLSNISDLFQRFMRTVGQQLEGIVKPALDLVLNMFEKLEAFARTRMGKIVIKIIAFSLALVALSVIIVGLKLLFSALGAVIWSALAPVLPFIAIIAAVVGLFLAVRAAINHSNESVQKFGVAIAVALGPLGWLMIGIKAVKEFDRFMEKLATSTEKVEFKSGFVQTMVRIGGLIRAAIELFRSANSEGFTLSENLANALDNLGILDIAISLGTWIVRIKEFFKGIGIGLREAYRVIKATIKRIFETFAPVFGVTESWEDFIGRNTSDMEKWRKAGEFAAYFIAAGILTLITLFVLLAAVMIIAFALPLIVLAVIALQIYFIIKVVNWFKEAIISVKDKFLELVNGAREWGKNLIQKFIDGIKERWNALKSGLIGLANKVRGWFGFDPIGVQGEGSTVGDTSGGDGSIAPTGPMLGPENVGQAEAENRAAGFAGSDPLIFENNTETVKNVTLVTELDGREISKKTVDLMETDSNR